MDYYFSIQKSLPLKLEKELNPVEYYNTEYESILSKLAEERRQFLKRFDIDQRIINSI